MKLLICWSHISGYMAASWRTLAKTTDIDLSIIAFKPPGTGSVAPFGENITAGLNCRGLTAAETADDDLIRSLAEQANPDIIMLNGWILPAYRKLPSYPALANKRYILTMDTPYRGSVRQRLARIKLAPFLKQMHAVMVPGERAWQYARHLGFDEDKIYRGMYGIDYDMLAPLYDRRVAPDPMTSQKPAASPSHPWPKKFLYVGRYVEDKAIDILVESYRRYCANVSDPWTLTACGAGPMGKLLDNVPNLRNRGFIQPADQPDLWAAHGAFILASRYDPWPLVIVEACAAGLPIICTEACGSSVELVRPQFNGIFAAPENAEALSHAMLWMHNNYDQCQAMGSRSRQFAAAYSSQMWTKRIVHMCAELTHA